MSVKNEGFLMVDHRASPGISEEWLRKMGLDPETTPFAPEGKMLEAATLVCSHCQKVAIKSPTRTRERGHCSKCTHYICDECNGRLFMTGECQLVRKRVEELQERFFLQQQSGSNLILHTQE